MSSPSEKHSTAAAPEASRADRSAKVLSQQFAVQFNGEQVLSSQNFGEPVAGPGYFVRLRQELLSAGEDWWRLLGSDRALRGLLTCTVRLSDARKHHQDVDGWLLSAAKLAIQRPGHWQRATAVKRVRVEARFEKALAPAPEDGQDERDTLKQHADWMKEAEKHLKSLLAKITKELPRDYASQADLLVQLGHTFRQAVASAIETPLNQMLQRMPQQTLEEKRELTKWLNAQLRRLGLAVRCPNTHRPSTVLVDVRDSKDQNGRFRLENWDENLGKDVRTATSTELPEFVLMEDEPRRETFASWQVRVRKSGQKKNRE